MITKTQKEQFDIVLKTPTRRMNGEERIVWAYKQALKAGNRDYTWNSLNELLVGVPSDVADRILNSVKNL